MSDEESEYTKPWIRHAMLWAGFAVLVIIGVWTVVLPSVEDSPIDPEVAAEEAEVGDTASDDDEDEEISRDSDE